MPELCQNRAVDRSRSRMDQPTPRQGVVAGAKTAASRVRADSDRELAAATPQR